MHWNSLNRYKNFETHKGQYLTGVVYPESVSFPEEEYSTYSAAAVVLAADSLMGITKALSFSQTMNSCRCFRF